MSALRAGDDLLYLTGTPGEKVIVTREPVGVVIAITPFNYPVTLLTFKLGAALIAALLDAGALGRRRSRDVGATVLSTAVSFAVAASAITCTRTGADPPTRAEIDEWIARQALVG